MTSPIRVGILGLTHDHIWGNLDDLNGLPAGKLVAAADPNQPLLDKIQSGYGCELVYTDYAAMLDQVDLDAVYVYGDNKTGVDLTIMAADSRLWGFPIPLLHTATGANSWPSLNWILTASPGKSKGWLHRRRPAAAFCINSVCGRTVRRGRLGPKQPGPR